MAVNTKHPEFTKLHPEWVKMRDCYSGERAIKSAGQLYLPATAGQIMDGMGTGQIGLSKYNAYKSRAVFPDYVKESIEAAIGVMHQKPPVIELPEKMKYLLEKASVHGETLIQLLIKINEEQLCAGRVGLLLDVAVNPETNLASLYIALYQAEDIINWDDGKVEDPTLQNLNLVVLNESEYERTQEFDWEQKEKYRVLYLGDLSTNEPSGQGVYTVAISKDKDVGILNAIKTQPMIKGEVLREIPFVFVNSKDVLAKPDEPPFLGLANLSLAIYKQEADYRHTLFMQGQETLVIIGLDEPPDGGKPDIRVGSDSNIILPLGGDAKYVGVQSKGLSEMRLSLENDRKKAEDKSGKLLDTTSRERESGEALQTRVAAQTATLTQIAKTSAFALEKLLKIAARWLGESAEQVKITPNLDFTNALLRGRELSEIMTARQLGAPLSLETVHKIMRDRGMTEMEFEIEMAKFEAEREKEIEMMGQGLGIEPDPNNPTNENLNQQI